MKNLTIYQVLIIGTIFNVTYNVILFGFQKEVVMCILLSVLLTCINFTIPDSYIRTKIKNI